MAITNTRFFILCANAGVWTAFLLWMFGPMSRSSGSDEVSRIAPPIAVPPSTHPPYRVTIVVYPGDVRGPRPNDRKDRLETIHTTWGSKSRTSVLGVDVLYVPDMITPARDEGLPNNFFLNVSRGLKGCDFDEHIFTHVYALSSFFMNSRNLNVVGISVEGLPPSGGSR